MSDKMPSTRDSTQSLPQEVVTCLENARFLHLATCHEQTPHVSLMSYTYLPSTPFSPDPTIIMTTPPSSRKTTFLQANPRVSLLVHDWVTHRPPTLQSNEPIPIDSSESNPTESARWGMSSGLASLLYGLNSASLSRISVSINGMARILDDAESEAKWCKDRHKEQNTFGDMMDHGIANDPGVGDRSGGAGCYIDDQRVRVVVVDIKDGRISDWKGVVRDWSLEGVNGVVH